MHTSRPARAFRGSARRGPRGILLSPDRARQIRAARDASLLRASSPRGRIFLPAQRNGNPARRRVRPRRRFVERAPASEPKGHSASPSLHERNRWNSTNGPALCTSVFICVHLWFEVLFLFLATHRSPLPL